jgi:putative nucleotidyltransferase with HDIG domain
MEDKEGSKRQKPWNWLLGRGGERRALYISLALLAVLMVMLILEYVPRAARFEVGKPSPETVISTRNFSVVDDEATETAREAERQRVKSLFINPNAYTDALAGMEEFVKQATVISGQVGDLEFKISQLKAFAPGDIDRQSMEALLTSSEQAVKIIYVNAVELLSSAMSEPVAFDNIDRVREEIRARVKDINIDDKMGASAAGLATAFLRINTAYASASIQESMDSAANYVMPVSFSFTAGQKIVDKGELITPFIHSALGEAGALSPVGTYQQALGIALLLIVIYGGCILFFIRFRPDIAANWRSVSMICLVFLVFSLLCRLFMLLADQNPVWGYLVPLALVGLTLAALLDHLVALFMVTVGGIVAGMILKGNFYLMITAIIGGVAGAIFVTRFRHRENIVRAGTELSVILAVVSMITASLFKDAKFMLMAGALGFANAVLSTLLTLGSLPVLERISGITTPMRLLELASPDHPLMRELVTKAPGTYSHSVIVGNLAHAAAREIGADALLARVGSYYHDIGKIKRSSFFVENQPQGFDGHEKIKPNLSALIIAAHVKDGVDLAAEYKLPSEITDIIRQHHGTSLIRFFYARALEEGSRVDAVTENRFRYSGEKPKSKEAAIVMLADAIEAAAKAQVKPNPVKLEQLSRALIKEKLDDGQLSESQLTLGDLDKISKTFVHILSAMYHERIEYPALVREAKIQ